MKNLNYVKIGKRIKEKRNENQKLYINLCKGIYKVLKSDKD